MQRISDVSAIKPSILVNRPWAAGILVVHGRQLHPIGSIVRAIRADVLDTLGLRELRRIVQDLVEERPHVDFPEDGIGILDNGLLQHGGDAAVVVVNVGFLGGAAVLEFWGLVEWRDGVNDEVPCVYGVELVLPISIIVITQRIKLHTVSMAPAYCLNSLSRYATPWLQWSRSLIPVKITKSVFEGFHPGSLL